MIEMFMKDIQLKLPFQEKAGEARYSKINLETLKTTLFTQVKVLTVFYVLRKIQELKIYQINTKTKDQKLLHKKFYNNQHEKNAKALDNRVEGTTDFQFNWFRIINLKIRHNRIERNRIKYKCLNKHLERSRQMRVL